MNSFWDKIFLGNTIQNWVIAASIIVAILIVAKILKRVLLQRFQIAAQRTSTTLDDFFIGLLQRSVMPVVYFIGIYSGIRYLTFPARAENILHAIFTTIIVFYIIRGLTDLISYSFQRYTTHNGEVVKQAKGILLMVKVLLWVIGFVFLLDNFGYNITTIVAGLGIGGIAIALAAQAVLADLFSYLVIFFDKPFETGDFIVIGDKSGVVEYIGIKTTRLRTLGGEQLILSNTDLTNSRVQNYKRMEKRRVLLTIGVTYETDPQKLKRIPGLIKEIIETQDDVLFERAHFSGFGDFSLNFEIVYHMLTADYLEYMESQQSFCFSLLDTFEKESIEFAYPTQKLFVSNAEIKVPAMAEQ
jgi:small-conductance mechanosensitive channel